MLIVSLAISNVVEKVHIVAGIVLNTLLLCLIRKHTRQNLGAYKQLLTIFASFDLFLVSLHFFNSPKVVIVGKIFGVVSDSFIEDRRLTSFHCTCFSVPFALINIHFLYRYWTVWNPNLIKLFSRPAFIFLLVAVTLSEAVAWYQLGIYGSIGDPESLRAAYERDYGKRITDGWLVIDYRAEADEKHYAALLFLFDFVMVISFTTAITLGALTYFGIRDAHTISKHYRAMQFRLLSAVTAQTLVPLVFVYVPYFFSVTLPYFDLPAAGIGSMCMLMTACFPAWDAVIIIVLMTDYREAIMKMTVHRCLKRSTPPSAHTTTRIETSLVTF